MGKRTQLVFGNSSGSDIDMRAELGKIFDGDGHEPPRGYYAILRRMKRDSNGHLIICPQCRKVGTQDHTRWLVCDCCLGSGHLWVEEWCQIYKWPGTAAARSRSQFKQYEPFGIIDTDLSVIYVRHHVKPTTDDKIIEVKLNDDGSIAYTENQYIRTELFDINDVDHWRLDRGKLEYFRITGIRVTVDYFGQPLATQGGGSRRTP